MITRYAMSWGKDKDDYIYVSPTESTNGNWVLFDDYAALHYERIHDLNQIGGLQEENARLKAEVERLRAASFVTAVPVEHYERVVKAGDAMAEWMDELGSPRAVPFFEAWKTAKEGKPSV